MEPIEVYQLGRRAYHPVWQAMRDLTDNRDADTPDQIWVVEHEPVFTQGQTGKAEHVLAAGDIPVVATDRGGQVTYHGPGQLVLYPLLDVRRSRIGVRELVTALENSVVDMLAEHGIEACARADAPGVYVGDAKIASLGLRIRRGASFHGVAVNLDGDMTPFTRINPCGYAGLAMTQLADLISERVDVAAETQRLLRTLTRQLGNRPLVECSGLPAALTAPLITD
ncbi:lipoyl(octanoyl) transferase LipB [Halomonas huangheensis]|uniref:Octanoyltransferase n=1 Tax=Halomonas huangheensis TaxID=1178482 RepID=W1ND33_9GAMM|nr:lipoyl(octanoyl) transferase LipB [Halomonas huangheensis]ALM52887.1 lipoate--protein ligase [Halomonas huangheensis]ERL53196.1 hypothetical protein BJB45_18150 [Halomonas huangheensis]